MTDAERSQQAALTGAPMEIIDRLLKEKREFEERLKWDRLAFLIFGFGIGTIISTIAYR